VEAESYPGPSLVIAYSHCIAHGIDMSDAMAHQKVAAQSGFWPLFRYDPRRELEGENPFQLDSRKPTKRLEEFTSREARFAMLKHANPEGAAELMARAQRDVDEQWNAYEQMARMEVRR
jgi:pyruvate-ferredoxin/flavodoxin oxidoreductase